MSDPRPSRDAVRIQSVESVGTDEDAVRTERTRGDRRERTRHGREEYPTIESVFESIERRIADGEMLTEPETRPDATWAVETVGGLTAVSDLMTSLDGDRETLRRIENRAARLYERAETIDVPVETLERLA